MLMPGLYAVVARRQARADGHDPHIELAGEPTFPLHVPATGEYLVIAEQNVTRRLVRGVGGPESEPEQPRRIRLLGDVTGEELDRSIEEVGNEVIAGLVATRGIDSGVVEHEFGRVVVGLGVHEAIVTVEAAAKRPAVERSGGASLGEWGHVPLADHIVAPAMEAQDLGTWVAAVEVGEAANAHRVRIATRQHCGTRRRAHGRGVQTRVAQTLCGESIDGRRPDRRAVAPEVGKAGIVEEHDENVRCAERTFRRGRPERCRVRNCAADATLEGVAHVERSARSSSRAGRNTKRFFMEEDCPFAP
jgi:hypothetical protein